MFGRNRGLDPLRSAEMVRFFEALDRLTADQLGALDLNWHAIPRADHEAAWAAVREVARRDGLTESVDRVRRAALDWTARGSNRPSRGEPDYRYWIELKIRASEAIVDAALAYALGSSLEPGAAEVLLAPWRSVKSGQMPHRDSFGEAGE